jgi:crossover junction endodeoxyribonuclease RuvC
MKILGIDPGTATVGWGIIEVVAGKPKVVAYGHIETSKTLPMPARLQEIRNDLRTIIERYHPDRAAVEELFFFNNQKTIITVAQARGTILLTLTDFSLSIAEYTPLEVKQSLTNYGRAEKHQMQLMVQKLLSLKEIPKPDDAADALAIALCHASRYRVEELEAAS